MRLPLAFSVAGITILIASVALYFVIPARIRQASVPSPTPTATPTPTPTPTPKPIPRGKQTFSVSSGKKTGPQFMRGEIDPYDPASQADQRVSVTVKSAKPVTTVSARLLLDRGKTIAKPMNLVEGTATDGRWEASWRMTESYLYIYNLILTASDGSEESTVELTLR